MRGCELVRIILEHSLLGAVFGAYHFGYLIDEVIQNLDHIGAHKIGLVVDENVEQLERAVLNGLDNVGHGAAEMNADQMEERLQRVVSTDIRV